MYVWLVAPPIGLPLSLHWLPLALLDVSVTLPPAQNVVGPPGVIVGVAGIGLTVTTTAAEAALVQELPSVTLTVELPLAVALWGGLVWPPVGVPVGRDGVPVEARGV